MDVNVKTPGSETAPTLTTEKSAEQSSTECQEVKNLKFFQPPNVKVSETSGEGGVTARDSLQASVVVSSESGGKDRKDKILQHVSHPSSSTADVISEGGKETDNKDISHHSMCTSTGNEPCTTKQDIISASRDGQNLSSTAQDGGGKPSHKSVDISQPPATVTTSLSPTSDPTVQENKRSFWPPKVTGIGASQTSEGKQVEVSPLSPGTAAESMKANVFEEIEMAVMPGTSQCSASNISPTKVSLDVGKENVKSGDSSQPSVSGDGVSKLVDIVASKMKFMPPELTEKHKSKVQDISSTINKMSSSTPCLSPSRKEADPDKVPRVIQKSTSSPVLPIIKITEADDVEEETRLSKSSDPVESTSEVGAILEQVESTEAVSEIQTTSKRQSSEPIVKSTKVVEEIEKICNPGNSAPILSNPEIRETVKENAGIAVCSTEQSLSNEEQNAMASDSPTNPPEIEECIDTTSEDGQQAFFYTSFSDIAPEFRYRTPCSSSEASSPTWNRQRSVGRGFCGSRRLHAVIVFLCIVVAMIGLAIYQLAHDGRMAKVYETVGLSCSIFAFVVGVFSTLYISAELCFPNLLSFQHRRMVDVEAANSLDRFLYPRRRYDVENIPLQPMTASRAGHYPILHPSPEQVRPEGGQSTSSLLDETHQLQTEVHGLLQSLSNAMSKQSLERSDDEPLSICEIESTAGYESASSQPYNYRVELPHSDHHSSESDDRSTPSKKDD